MRGPIEKLLFAGLVSSILVSHKLQSRVDHDTRQLLEINQTIESFNTRLSALRAEMERREIELNAAIKNRTRLEPSDRDRYPVGTLVPTDE